MPHSPKRAAKLKADLDETVRLFLAGLNPTEIANRLGVERPCIRARLIKTGHWKPDKKNRASGLRGCAAKAGRPKLPPGPRPDNDEAPVIVDRTPCPWCSVRADIGCRHSGRRLVGC